MNLNLSSQYLPMKITGPIVTIITTSISMTAAAESVGLRSLHRYKSLPIKGQKESETAILAIIKDTPLAVSDGEILSKITPFSPMGSAETLASAVSPPVLSIIVAESCCRFIRFIVVSSSSMVHCVGFEGSSASVHRRWFIVVGYEVDVVDLIVAVIACLF